MGSSGQVENVLINYTHGIFSPAWAKSDHNVTVVWEHSKEHISFLFHHIKWENQKHELFLFLTSGCCWKRRAKHPPSSKICDQQTHLPAPALPSYCRVREWQDGDHTLLVLEQRWGPVTRGLHFAVRWSCGSSALAPALLVTYCSSLLLLYLV